MEAGVGFLKGDGFRIAVAGKACGEVIGGVEEPSIACFGREEDKLVGGDNASVASGCPSLDGVSLVGEVRSAERQQKEQAMHARFCERIETALASLQRRIERARKPIDRGAAERQTGRLLGRNSRAAARYAIRLVDDENLAAGLRLE